MMHSSVGLRSLDLKNLRIAYSSRPGMLASLTRFLTRSNVNHTLFLIEENGTELVIDADWNGMVVRTRERWNELGCTIVDVPPLVKSIDNGIPTLLKMLDAPYDYTGLLGMPIVLMGRFWFHRRWRNPWASPSALFCSESAAMLLQSISYPGANKLVSSEMDPGALRDWQVLIARRTLKVEI